jgi:diaminopimelate decarboxylase
MSDSKALDINEISTHIWPKNAVRNKEGILEVAGLDVIELEQKFETPLFILD